MDAQEVCEQGEEEDPSLFVFFLSLFPFPQSIGVSSCRFYVPWHLAISFILVMGEQPCLLLPPLHFPWVGRRGKPETDFSLYLELGELQVSCKWLSKFIASHILLLLLASECSLLGPLAWSQGFCACYSLYLFLKLD